MNNYYLSEENKNMTGYASKDRPWLKFYPPGASKIEDINLTYYQYYVEANKKFLDKAGIEYYNRIITRKDIIKESDQLAKVLQKYGVKKRDQILLGTIGVPEAFYTIMALSKIGAGANIINITYPNELIIDSVKQADFDVFIVLDVFYDLFEDALKLPEMKNKKIIVIPFTNSFPLGTKTVMLAQRIKNKKKFDKLKEDYNLNLSYYNDAIKECINMPDVEAEPYDKELKFLTVYSSGTTAKAKGINLPIDSITYMARNHELADLGTDENTASLHKVPINFSTGVNNNFLLPPLVGMINVLDPVFDKKTIGKSFKNHKHKIGVAIISNEMWEAVGNSKLKKDTLSNLTHPIAGGDGASVYRQEQIYNNLKKFGCKRPLFSGAGSTEVGACATTTLRQAYKAGTAGVPLPQVNAMIIDDEGKELKYNESGEICYSTPMMMLGYLNDEEKTRKSFIYVDSEKFYKTGDIGYIDSDGFVTYRGRKNDFIIVKDDNGNDFKQYLFEIEEIAKKYSFIMDCEAVGIDFNSTGYSKPVIHLQFTKEFTGNKYEAIEKIIIDFKENLPSFSVPIAFKIREDFPIAKSGKRDNKKLSEEKDGYINIDKGIIYECNFNQNDVEYNVLDSISKQKTYVKSM